MVDISRLDKITSRKQASKEPGYSDFYLNLNRHPESNKLLRSMNEEAVKRSIRQLLLTNSGERLYNPDFGGNLGRYLFEDISVATSQSIKSGIKYAIDTYEPRAILLDVVVVPNEVNNSYEIAIYFEVINSVTPATLALTLYRVR